MRYRGKIELLIFVLLFAIVAVLSLYPTFLWWRHTPDATAYSFTYGHTGDYFQLLHFVNSGMHGKLLYTIPYTEDRVPSIFVQPVYFVTGFILSPLTKSPIVALFVLRILALLIFFTSLTLLLYRVFKSFIQRLLTAIFVVAATSFWTVAPQGGGTVYHIPIEWNDTFNVYRKFVIPPHHLLAVSCVMVLMIVLASRRWDARHVIATTLLTISAGLLHPYHLLLICGIGVVSGIIVGIQKKRIVSALDRTLPIIVPTGIIYIYYNRMTQLVYPWIRPDTLTSIITPQALQTLWPYVLAIGPIFFLSLLFLIPLLARRSSLIEILLLLWAVIPFVAFLFPGAKIMQPFKTHQYIPLSFLGASGISYVIRRKKVFALFIPLLVGSTLVYAYFPYTAALQHERELIQDSPSDFAVYMPDSLVRTFEFLDRHTPKHSVVLAGEQLSFMIPAFTQDNVVIGQSDSIAQYNERVAEVHAVFNAYGQGDGGSFLTFMKNHRISYVVFGMDTPLFNSSFTGDVLQDIYHDIPVTVAKVVQ